MTKATASISSRRAHGDIAVRVIPSGKRCRDHHLGMGPKLLGREGAIAPSLRDGDAQRCNERGRGSSAYRNRRGRERMALLTLLNWLLATQSCVKCSGTRVRWTSVLVVESYAKE